jgi:signal transduction histidine kinase
MNFLDFLKDKLSLIIFYFILMTFITITIFIDKINNILSSNIIYLLTVSTVLFILYLIIDFLKIRNYSNELKKLSESKDVDCISIIPEAVTYEQKLYNEFVKNMYYEYSNKISQIQSEFKDNTDFLTAWVHEIKTPITAIKLATENNVCDEETMEIIQEEIKNIDDFVQKVLYYSRINDFSKDYVINTLDISKVVKNR